jgi:hypothetical protein
MKSLAVLPLLLLVACPTTKNWNEMTPEEKTAHLDYQEKRVQLYLDFAKLNADKFVEAGKWDKATVDLAFAASNDAIVLYTALKAADGGTLEQQYDARLKLEEAALKWIALGIDRALAEDTVASASVHAPD